MKQPLERVDRLTEPLVVGRYYLVPTIRHIWNHTIRAWPVLGPEHDDADRFEFKGQHYHIDARFLGRRHPLVKQTFRQPLHTYPGASLPAPILKPMRCYQSLIHYPFGHYAQIQTLRADFAGHQCARGKGGWICPHRKASLGNVESVDGIITCPLHGMMIEAATGIVLPSTDAILRNSSTALTAKETSP